jgi:hypothetical protein
VAEKLQQEGMLGAMFNQAIREIAADVAIILCDDDVLVPEYLHRLSNWFDRFPDELSGYSHVIPFDPLSESVAEVPVNRWQSFHLNVSTHRLAPSCVKDASQVAWRTECNLVRGAWFKERLNACQDAHFYSELTAKCGLTPFTGLIGQYKGMHALRLGVLGPERALIQEIDLPG